MESDLNCGIQEFYTGQSILLTGATGFLGKAITEKLLRTCPDVNRLFLLIRTKKGKNSKERIEALFDDPVFGPMKSENPDYLSKVTVISGDISLPYLDISDDDRKRLIEEVTIVFHGAATVRFDEQLKTAITINIAGTKELLHLCAKFRNLKALVHVSTAYANCNKDEIKEMVYKPPITGNKLIDLAKHLPDELIQTFLPMIIGDWPNTYAFTKQVAEDLVAKEAVSKGIPVAILRPAIVIGSYSEPIPGWIDNFYGPTGVTATVSAGLVRTLQCNSDLRAELVPVDMTVNAVLAVAWELARNERNVLDDDKERNYDCVPVYNYASSKRNPLTWGKYMDYNTEYGVQYPTIKAFWYYSLTMTKHLSTYYFLCFFLHILPAFLIDTILMIIIDKPRAIKMYQKVHKFLGVISYFSTKEWNFHNNNVVELWGKLSEKDKKLFNFDMDVVDWNLYFSNHLYGIRVFLLKEQPDTLPASRKRYFKLYVLHRLVQVLFVTTTIWVLWSPVISLHNLMLQTFNPNSSDIEAYSIPH